MHQVSRLASSLRVEHLFAWRRRPPQQNPRVRRSTANYNCQHLAGRVSRTEFLPAFARRERVSYAPLQRSAVERIRTAAARRAARQVAPRPPAARHPWSATRLTVASAPPRAAHRARCIRLWPVEGGLRPVCAPRIRLSSAEVGRLSGVAAAGTADDCAHGKVLRIGEGASCPAGLAPNPRCSRRSGLASGFSPSERRVGSPSLRLAGMTSAAELTR